MVITTAAPNVTIALIIAANHLLGLAAISSGTEIGEATIATIIVFFAVSLMVAAHQAVSYEYGQSEANMSEAKARITEPKRKVAPTRQLEQKPMRQDELAAKQKMRSQAALPCDLVAFKPLRQADVLAMQRTLGNQRVQQLIQSSQRRVQRWSLEGPWNIGEPVHESLTQQSLRAAGLIGMGDKYTSREAWEYIRGSIWNDDPNGSLFDDRFFGFPTTRKYSSGAKWMVEFHSGKKAAEKGKKFGRDEANLLKRSHFGDLQFLHGMAESGEEAATTHANVLRWSEFTYKIATAGIPAYTLIRNVPVSGISSLFPKLGNLRVDELFAIKCNLRMLADVKKRAAGSLLHMIQDTYTESHTEREEVDKTRRGKIKSFHAYAEQDPESHKEKDVIKGKGSLAGKISQTPGAQDAVNQGARVLRMIGRNTEWLEVDPAEGKSPQAVLEDILGLAQETSPAGPGEQFRKAKSKPPANLKHWQEIEIPPPWTRGSGSIY
ncbi:MAG: hypothetical protein R3E79_39075 [Caldilineaceae bacterium]